MANEDELHRCVTEFMFDTCQYSPEVFEVQTCLSAYLRFMSKEFMDFFKVFTSGSSAEFYIKPLLSCIGDIDVMMCQKDVIVIPAGQTPPTELPDYYHSIVTVYEMIDSHQPGYVYLQQSHTLKKNDNDLYVVLHTHDVPQYIANVYPLQVTSIRPLQYAQLLYTPTYFDFLDNNSLQGTLEIHGPAIKQQSVYLGVLETISVDGVICVQCPDWPLQAADWPTRSRSHNWPDSATINSVVGNGCNVVRAVHPSCKQDEWMSKYQWRLSFSRAEVTLLNSWTPVQQIVYHMLRFVIKREILTEEYEKDPNLPKLSTYHIKTLMLWECEQKPQSWWSAESSLIKLCSSLLHKLSDCVAVKRCVQYFINNCNLLDHFVDNDNASLILCNSLDAIANVPVLLSWFVENYVLYSAKELMVFDEICPNNIATQVRIVAEYQVKKIQHDLCTDHQVIETVILISSHSRQVFGNKWTQSSMEELQSYNARLRDYFVAVTSLNVAYNTSIHSLTEELLETLWKLFNPCTTCVVDQNTHQSMSRALLSISKAIVLSRLNNVHSNALGMLHNEMSKAYLHHSFAYGQESTYCVVHILLAVLYYKSGHYQAAMDHCKQVLKQTACKQYGLYSIGAEYLPQIDENVVVVIGLILIYQHVKRNELKSADHLHPNNTDLNVPAFTTEILARYLQTLMSVLNHEGNEVSMYRQLLFHSHRLHLSDVLLFKTLDTQLTTYTRMPVVKAGARNVGNSASSAMDTSLLVTSLELVALEKLITYRQIVRELHSEQYPVIDEFEALYAYKCGLYEECLEMCRSCFNTTLHLDCWKDRFFLVSFPEMLTLLDGELVSLFGIVRLANHMCFVSFLLHHPHFVGICVRTLLLYLMVQCQKKLFIDMHDMLQLIRFVHDAMDDEVDRLVLKVIYRSLKMDINCK